MEIQVESAVEREWKPTQKQRDFIKIPFSVFEALYGGAAGAGKTDLAVLLPLIYRFHENPYYKGLTLRRHLPELEKELIARSAEIYPSTGAVYNEVKKRWKWKNGAVHYFGAADKEKDIRKFDSDQYNLLLWDEATHFTGFQYKYLSFSRVRSRTSSLPAIVRGGTNPGNVGHAFFKDRFVAPNKAGYKILVDEKTGLKRLFIPAKVTDNPHLLRANPNYIAQLETLPEAEKKAKLFGDWDTFEGQVFKEFRIAHEIDEPENAIHVIEPFDIPVWWPRIIGIDWGWEAFTCIYWAAISPQGRVFIYREYAQKRTLTDDWIAEMINLTGDELPMVMGVRICHSANQHRGERSTIFDKLGVALRDYKFNCRLELGERNRINGKLAVHEYLRWEQKKSIKRYFSDEFSNETAQQIYRIHGQKAYEQYVAIYAEDIKEDNLPKLQIFNTCELLPDAISNCVYEEAPEEGKLPEDVKEFDGDDPYDCLRILLNGITAYITGNAKERDNAHKTEQAIKAMATGNQTAFYRQMERMERTQAKPLSFRRRRFSRASR